MLIYQNVSKYYKHGDRHVYALSLEGNKSNQKAFGRVGAKNALRHHQTSLKNNCERA